VPIRITLDNPGRIHTLLIHNHADDSPPQATAATKRRLHCTSDALASLDNTSIDQSAIAADARGGRFRFWRPSPDAEDIMQDQENEVFDALQRTGTFLDESAEALSGADFTAARKRLDEVVTNFSTDALEQDINTCCATGETPQE